ncbi:MULTISPECIES: murein hydrolase activator NlpD [Symbiopectobacterium]|uniref:murein hydrolase activator NlpD n=1 Tax=Symbiopectobacterium TaxID=801 RepID=UPI001A285A5A|nr:MULTISPECIES: murein hydrolase activator NlpD [Symbiopectobacterium]MBG6248800.1 murein hydrolase activator NlpD [Candidatus Symbiopectobacterium sp. PLON1]MBT9430417.1 murein hydrolase activator NlpD [Candidatus Symbiopectobacterium endolongispinus]
MRSQTRTLRQMAACTAIILGLAGCSNNDSKPAPISSVGGQGNSSSRGGMLATAPSNISSSGDAPITTRDGRIVYNRSYNAIPKGSYGGSTYTVKRGDTLFYIAWITGSDYRELAQRNNVPEPYSLNVGQVLQVSDGSSAPVSSGSAGGGMLAPSDATRGGVPQPPSMTQIQATQVDSQSTNAYSGNSGKQNVGKMLPSTGAAVTAPVTATAVVESSAPAVDSWRWPTEGKVIDSFSASEGGNKGIDIAGTRGQPIMATASGRVVYAGNALRGYGNLIIIKHDDDYLSAYAHNDTILVREQQEVKAGQQIATMGSTGTSSVRLHFEIRYKGKSVNPLCYLPQR